MKTDKQKAIAKAVLERYPESYSEMLGIDLAKNTPAPLFQWLNCALLMSARISASQAQRAAGALFTAGFTTPDKMAKTNWDERVKVLNKNGYARYDESTARYIADTTAKLKEDYGGDLRKLREEAGHDPEAERKLLKEFKGIGDVGADIFLREVQTAWDELYPFVDSRAAKAAENLGLDPAPKALSRLANGPGELARLLTGLVQTDLDNAGNDILKAAA
ncbi:hypothetical protein [Martelella endophytica]|uniref:HhH-GPD domain-containing protein n=1 Tax=Martelella endophytica TaxID=1486262 RepID=A0A0D5LQT2_MAREN|nr:hypothetical protein [Martelella endophytica]AJY46466.1 hypothetical protein TM49_13510 [Martelella endophytica]